MAVKSWHPFVLRNSRQKNDPGSGEFPRSAGLPAIIDNYPWYSRYWRTFEQILKNGAVYLKTVTKVVIQDIEQSPQYCDARKGQTPTTADRLSLINCICPLFSICCRILPGLRVKWGHQRGEFRTSVVIQVYSSY